MRVIVETVARMFFTRWSSSPISRSRSASSSGVHLLHKIGEGLQGLVGVGTAGQAQHLTILQLLGDDTQRFVPAGLLEPAVLAD